MTFEDLTGEEESKFRFKSKSQYPATEYALIKRILRGEKGLKQFVNQENLLMIKLKKLMKK